MIVFQLRNTEQFSHVTKRPALLPKRHIINGTESDTQCNGDALYDNSLAVERSIGKFYKLLIYCLLGVRQCME